MNDVTTAIRARSNGIKIYNKGEKFLSAIDSVTNTIPHSNEAAKKARRNGDTLQHHFGTASYFLTINQMMRLLMLFKYILNKLLMTT